MARQVTWGTPSRAKHLLHPRPAYALVFIGLGLGIAVGGALLALHAAGRRGALSPGPVASPHAPLEARCEECHAPGEGAKDARCQRCHDPAAAGRLTNAAHVFFGSRDPAAAAAAPVVPCATCHVEHAGRDATLRRVSERRCHECHFRSLGAHPEFAPLRQPSVELPGLRFDHQRHVKELVETQGLAAAAACTRCHAPRDEDFRPLAFDEHCAACHARRGSVGTLDPIPEGDVLSLEAIRARGVEQEWVGMQEGFEARRGRIARASLRHADPWVLYNAARLRARLFPEAVAVQRGALQARVGQLQRRLVFATPLAGLDAADLEARARMLESELRGAETRLAALEHASRPVRGLARIDEVLGAAEAAGAADVVRRARSLRAQARALEAGDPAPEALGRDAWESGRDRLLAALDAVRAADPVLEARAEDLRRRLLALRPGDDAEAVLRRVRDQRQAELERVRDEQALRAGGTAPPRAVLLVRQRAVVEEALLDAERRLAELDGVAGEPPYAAGERESALESFAVLTAACVKCHVSRDAAFEPVAAARPVLVRSRFVHRPHLMQAECARCHPGVAQSTSSAELNLRGIDGCRECHGGGGVFEECQSCHDYHPPVAP